MPVADLRPRGLDFKFRPGDEYDIRLNGPAGWLAGRSFTAALGEDALTVTEDGDALVVSLLEAVSTNHPVSAGKAEWVLTEVGGNDVLTGVWEPSNKAAQASTLDLTITLGTLDVDVELVVGVGSILDGGSWAGSGDDVHDGGGW